MTNAERHKIARAIFEVIKLPGADRDTCLAVAQSIVAEFAADEKFTPSFVISACGMYTNVNYRAKLAAGPNGEAR